MEDNEKKEFEEFLKWKAEKAKRQELESASKTLDKMERKEKDKNVVPSPESRLKGNNTISGVSFALIIFGVVCILVLIISFFNKNPDKPIAKVESKEMVTDTVALNSSKEVDQIKEKKTWDFSFKTDAMTDSKNIWAEIKSDNFIYQDFPYEGPTAAIITIRYMKKYGYDVMVSISQGQIHGSEYNGDNYITARFDGGTPKKYYFSEASDGSNETVFINSCSDFIKHCKRSKDIKIDIPLFQNGRPVFSFHVDEPLVWREK